MSKTSPTLKEDIIRLDWLLSHPTWREMYWVVWGCFRIPFQGSKFSYVSTLSACATGKEWQQAFQQLPQMVRKRMQLDVIEFNVSMSCVCCWEEVRTVGKKMTPNNFCNANVWGQLRYEVGESAWKETLRAHIIYSEAFVFPCFFIFTASFLSF